MTMFPHDRFDVTWPAARPEGEAYVASAGLPIGHTHASLRFEVWVDADGVLLTDWPGLPGTAGARLETRLGPGSANRRVVGTSDPILQGFAGDAPLRRRLAERFAARCSSELGLVGLAATDFVPCEAHGHGLPCVSCEHLLAAGGPVDGALLYDVDGDFPDFLCLACVERLTGGDVSVCVGLCSRCQRDNVRHNRVVAASWYGDGS